MLASRGKAAGMVIVETGEEASEWLEKQVGGARWRVVQTLRRLGPTSAPVINHQQRLGERATAMIT